MSEEVLHRTVDPNKVKLMKGQKDSYGWEISLTFGDEKPADLIARLQEIDQQLRTKYKQETE